MTDAQIKASEEAIRRGLTLEQFILNCEIEDFNDEEINDVDFLFDRIDVWLESYGLE